MQTVKAPSDALAHGGDDLDAAERAELHRAIDNGIDDFENGETEDAFEFLARLKARLADRDRQASEPAGRTNR